MISERAPRGKYAGGVLENKEEKMMLDYLIKNGWIVNGKNETPFRGDLAIREGRILKIASHLEVPSDFPGRESWRPGVVTSPLVLLIFTGMVTGKL